jgi:hypothetical protein
MTAAKDRFFVDYDAWADETMHSLHQFFAENVQRWISLLDETPESARIVGPLGERLNRDQWGEKYTTAGSQIGGGTLKWPQDRRLRLGAQLDLFRIFASGEWDAAQFGFLLLRTGEKNGSAIVRSVSEHVFGPLVRELRRYIEDAWIDDVSALIPASDRVVTRDHNSAPAQDALVEELIILEDFVTKTNGPIEREEKEQAVAELSAATRLLRSTRFRLAPLLTLLRPVLRFLMEKFAGAAVGLAAKAVWDKLGELLITLHLPPL